MDDFDKVFSALNKQRPDGLYPLAAGPLMRPNRKRIVDFALKSRLPSVSSNREDVEAGGLMSYGRTSRTSTAASPPMLTRSLKAPSPPTFPSSSRRSSSW